MDQGPLPELVDRGGGRTRPPDVKRKRMKKEHYGQQGGPMDEKGPLDL